MCVIRAGAAEAQWWEEFGANRSTDCSGSGQGKRIKVAYMAHVECISSCAIRFVSIIGDQITPLKCKLKI